MLGQNLVNISADGEDGVMGRLKVEQPDWVDMIVYF